MDEDSTEEEKEAEGSECSDDEAGVMPRSRQNGAMIRTAERCAILYDKSHQCIFDDRIRQQPQQQQQPQPRRHLASLWLSKPAFVVRSLREVLEPGELNTAWRSAKEASFSCYNRNVLVGVKRLHRGGVAARTEDVRQYADGEIILPSFVGYKGYFSKEDFEEETAEAVEEDATANAEQEGTKAAARSKQKLGSGSVGRSRRT